MPSENLTALIILLENACTVCKESRTSIPACSSPIFQYIFMPHFFFYSSVTNESRTLSQKGNGRNRAKRTFSFATRSEERRVGKECRDRWARWRDKREHTRKTSSRD